MDRFQITAFRATCETIGDMALKGWRVRSKCPACRNEMDVDLRLLALAEGADLSLWNRRSKCRKVGCGGRVIFLGAPRKVGVFSALWDDGRPGRPSYLDDL